MKAYAAEQAAGVAEAVERPRPIAFLARIEAAPPAPDGPARARSLATASLGAVADSIADGDLFYYRSILASTGWNLNDHVFLGPELLAAATSVVDKPVNLEHDQGDIVGHVVSAQPVDAEMAPIAADADPATLPDLFHVAVGSVVYRHIGGEARADQVEGLIAAIVAGRKSVSMEAWMADFDYALVHADGRAEVVARTDATAWMTPYLRAFAPPDLATRRLADPRLGSGTVETASGPARVGCLMRGLTFCGKGIVDTPANPHSAILPAVAAFAPGPAPAAGPPAAVAVYEGPIDPQPAEDPMPQTTTPADAAAEPNPLQARVDQLEAEAAGLRDQLAAANRTQAEADLLAARAELATARSQVSLQAETIATLTARAEAAEGEVAGLRQGEVDRLAAEEAAARATILADAHCPEDKRATVAAGLAHLDRPAFAAFVDTIRAGWKAAPAAPIPAETPIARARVEAAANPALPLATAAAADAAARAEVATYFSTFLA